MPAGTTPARLRCRTGCRCSATACRGSTIAMAEPHIPEEQRQEGPPGQPGNMIGVRALGRRPEGGASCAPVQVSEPGPLYRLPCATVDVPDWLRMHSPYAARRRGCRHQQTAWWRHTRLCWRASPPAAGAAASCISLAAVRWPSYPPPPYPSFYWAFARKRGGGGGGGKYTISVQEQTLPEQEFDPCAHRRGQALNEGGLCL